MQHPLKIHFQKFIEIEEEEFSEIIRYFRMESLKKKENLLVEGEVCKANYFVVKGILRKFFINEKGVEQTTEFAIENWWMTETFSILHQSPTEFYIQAVEASEVLAIQRDRFEDLVGNHPIMEKYFRQVYQKSYAAAQMRIKFQYEHSREELYHFFREKQPEFLQRVPQYLIASYLGFTPEYLSEIRRKSIS